MNVRDTSKDLAYIFETAFGWCSITFSGESVVDLVLPGVSGVSELKSISSNSSQTDDFQRDVIRRVCGYFEGKAMDFADVAVELPFGSAFSRRILEQCRLVRYGELISYGELAALAGFEGSARAAGNILGSNPVPLIIPCHRVIKSDGSTGGFMRNTQGASDIKQRMIDLERNIKV